MPNPSAKIIIRYYVNGTIARFLGYYFDSYIVAPQSLASDMTQTNFTDGSFVQFFEVSGRKVYFPPPRPAAEPTYFKAQAILSIESNAYALSRIVYRNGTVATRNDSNGAIIGFEVPPTSWQPSFEIKLISACQWEEIDYIKDVRNMFYCLPNSTWTAWLDTAGVEGAHSCFKRVTATATWSVANATCAVLGVGSHLLTSRQVRVADSCYKRRRRVVLTTKHVRTRGPCYAGGHAWDTNELWFLSASIDAKPALSVEVSVYETCGK